MAYDDDLAQRIRELMSGEPAVSARAMFGGLAFLVGGSMAVAASGRGGIMVRIDPAEHDTLLQEPHAGPMEMRGREMAGWLRVAPEGLTDDAVLSVWVQRGVSYARSLPPR